MSQLLPHLSALRPQALLRLDLVRWRIDRLVPGTFLEVGPGPGDLASYLVARGFLGTLLEPSPAALISLRARFAGVSGVELAGVEALAFDRPGAFELVLLCEVLEHVEDDQGLLRHLARQLTPGGRLVGSVPAFRRQWSASDEAVGHLRRYERDELVDLLARADLEVVGLWCYGFPLANALAPLRAAVGWWRALGGGSERERSFASGLQPGLVPRSPVWRWLFAPALALQRWSAVRDWGTGWVFEARRS